MAEAQSEVEIGRFALLQTYVYFEPQFGQIESVVFERDARAFVSECKIAFKTFYSEFFKQRGYERICDKHFEAFVAYCYPREIRDKQTEHVEFSLFFRRFRRGFSFRRKCGGFGRCVLSEKFEVSVKSVRKIYFVISEFGVFAVKIQNAVLQAQYQRRPEIFGIIRPVADVDTCVYRAENHVGSSAVLNCVDKRHYVDVCVDFDCQIGFYSVGRLNFKYQPVQHFRKRRKVYYGTFGKIHSHAKFETETYPDVVKLPVFVFMQQVDVYVTVVCRQFFVRKIFAEIRVGISVIEEQTNCGVAYLSALFVGHIERDFYLPSFFAGLIVFPCLENLKREFVDGKFQSQFSEKSRNNVFGKVRGNAFDRQRRRVAHIDDYARQKRHNIEACGFFGRRRIIFLGRRETVMGYDELSVVHSLLHRVDKSASRSFGRSRAVGASLSEQLHYAGNFGDFFVNESS